VSLREDLIVVLGSKSQTDIVRSL